MFFNLIRSLEGDIVSNALLKSNAKSKVICLLFMPRRMSSVNLSNAVSVLLYCLKPVCNESNNLLLCKNDVIWSCANFSKTLDKKQRRATGLKSEQVDGTEVFFIQQAVLFSKLGEIFP